MLHKILEKYLDFNNNYNKEIMLEIPDFDVKRINTKIKEYGLYLNKEALSKQKNTIERYKINSKNGTGRENLSMLALWMQYLDYRKIYEEFSKNGPNFIKEYRYKE